MKKIKAFFYVAYKSVVSPKYYGEILKTPFEFSLKYYAVLVLIAAVITSVGTYFIEAPKIKDTFQNALTEAEKVYPEDLIFTIKAGEWEINKPEPLVIPFPGTYEAKDKEKLPENLVVFDKAGTVEDLEKRNTAILVNEKNLLVKKAGEPGVYPLKGIPDTTLDKGRVVGAIGDVRKISGWLLPLILILPVFAGLMVYYAIFRGAYLIIVGGLLFILGRTLKNGVSYKNAFRIALHTMTLPVLIDTVFSLINLQLPLTYWFLAVNLVMGIFVLREVGENPVEGVVQEKP
ncbi:hypothetical protein A2473_01390 [candidate division WWE3 bacterium RIFOXYC2_FULL_42_13]|uniref:DUF1189 domain-containing protein n=2 Tax=Katanobacteria TaxID=422282 RepID=A0A3D0ZQN2_UNCKA|nr:MAG: hypothetical protein A2245_01655 [candidate division WWE3 bacterium RIFOXYA2_FULL_43_12]OGC73661.1 MAG: hypothetical protein A2473_01390 [candidate division WWE3 bacterium RIFOXYC2_FULL_42_13]OGC75215.1 MAG: hypothetical protein A2547_02275 [candidate division WWE3 bacterium RIFOXYD2_FULL_43_10]HBY10310.1 hypothetical protein [candidate division WWE3 bacterium]HCC42033.1 hypothetical protein [candidate division WWE3 bacterium]